MLSLRGGYHGDTFGAMGVCDPVDGMHSLFTDVLADNLFAPRPPGGVERPLDKAYVEVLAELVEGHRDELAAVVIEPVVPEEWGLDVGHPLPTDNGYRWRGFPVLRTNELDGKLVLDQGASVTIENYEHLLKPALIPFYEANGFCYVVTGSQQYGRALVDLAAVPQAIAYYRALARDGKLVYESSPYARGSKGVEFNFDWAFDYYPLAYVRPGPMVKIFRLSGGGCANVRS